jgi:hypothetical protein
MNRLFQTFTILLFAFTVVTCGPRLPHFREGDVVFLVAAIPHTDPVLLATKSNYGHVGIILRHNGQLMFFEAVSPVKYTPIESWLKKQEGRRFVVKRLRNADGVLTGSTLSRLDSLASTFEGRPYDSRYNWSDEKLYCSELVWKLYHRIVGIDLCSLRKLKDYDLTSPDVQEKLRERFPEGVPLEETVVSPQDLFESTSLIPVYEQ